MSADSRAEPSRNSEDAPTEGADAGGAHTERDIQRAAASLDRADLKRLRMAAGKIVCNLGLDDIRRDWEDLLAEALTRTMDGTRSWRRGVDFIHHLCQAMRSVGWQWRRRESQREHAVPTVPWETLGKSSGDGKDSIERPEKLFGHDPDFDARLLAYDQLKSVLADFAGDPAAQAVMDGWAMDRKSPEVCQRAGLTEKEYRAAVRRLRRYGERHRGENHVN